MRSFRVLNPARELSWACDNWLIWREPVYERLRDLSCFLQLNVYLDLLILLKLIKNKSLLCQENLRMCILTSTPSHIFFRKSIDASRFFLLLIIILFYFLGYKCLSHKPNHSSLVAQKSYKSQTQYCVCNPRISRSGDGRQRWENQIN